jgi:uncharacterized protein (DUF1330 family)
MKYYAVAKMDFTNNDWVTDYLKNVTPMVEKVGGRYLARTPSLELIEGDGPAPQTIVLIEFPSRDAAEAFYYSDEYQPYKDARQSGSVGQFYLVAGQDIAKM